jgi:hypothetical protein
VAICARDSKEKASKMFPNLRKARDLDCQVGTSVFSAVTEMRCDKGFTSTVIDAGAGD